jgi:acyl carrier protein
VDDIRARLGNCFAAVFPTLSPQEIAHANPHNVSGWDSVASVTLFATIEEEFGLELEIADLPGLVSFEKIAAYLTSKVTA